MGGLSASLVIFRLIYGIFLSIFDVKEIQIWELSKGMLLARKTIEVMKEDNDLISYKIGSITADGLTAEQVEIVRRWWIDRGKGGQIWVCKTMPFAWALCVGTLFTILCKGYVLDLRDIF